MSEPNVTITFSWPEHEEAVYDALKGADWRCVMQDIDNVLRARLKYNANKHWDFKTVEEIRNLIYKELELRDLKLFL